MEGKKGWYGRLRLRSLIFKTTRVSITDLDRVEPGLEDTLKENDTVNVIRVEKVTDVVENDSNLLLSQRKIIV